MSFCCGLSRFLMLCYRIRPKRHSPFSLRVSPIAQEDYSSSEGKRERANSLDTATDLVGSASYRPLGVAEKRHRILNDTRKMYYRHHPDFFWTALCTAGRSLILGIHLWKCSSLSFLKAVRLFSGVYDYIQQCTHAHTFLILNILPS